MLLVLTDLLCKEKYLQRGMRPQDFCDSRQVQRIGLYGTDLVRKFGGIDRDVSSGNDDNPLSWWKQHGHLFPTLSRLACRYLTVLTTSCPVERLFSVTGQVDAARRKSVSGHHDTSSLLA